MPRTNKIFETYIVAVIIATTVLVSTGGCSDSSEEQNGRNKNAKIKVSTLELEPQTWGQAIHSFGVFESTEEVNISVDYTGTATEVNFEEGQSISAGQLLIKFDDRKQRLRLQQAQANVASTQALLERAQSTYQRHRQLLQNNMLSKEQFKLSESDLEGARANLKQTLAAAALARQELEETVVISPVDGIVKKRNVEVGQTVLPGVDLAVVQVTDTMRVVTYVTEKEVNSLRVGMEAPITTPGIPGQTYEGRIELIGSSADNRTGNFPVKLTVNNKDGLLREGMSARVRLTGYQQQNIILVPRHSIVDRLRRKVVFRVIDGKAQAVEPVFGVSASNEIPVLAGLTSGDQIILNHLDVISDGTPVKAKQIKQESFDPDAQMEE